MAAQPTSEEHVVGVPQQIERDELRLPALSSSSSSSAAARKLVFEHFSAAAHNALCSSSNAGGVRKADFDASCSTGVRVYDGSKVLAIFFTSSPHARRIFDSSECRVIELGCGAGVAGVAAALSSSATSTVTFTDMEPRCLQLAERNIELNSDLLSVALRRPEQITQQQQKKRFKFCRLTWEKEAVQEHLIREFPASSSAAQNRYHVVIAAELLYFRVDPVALVSTVASLLEPTCGVVFFCGVNRIPGGDARQKFLKIIEAAGLSHRAVSLPAAVKDSPHASDLQHLSPRLDFIVAAWMPETINSMFPDQELFDVARSVAGKDDNRVDDLPGDGLFE